jgi:hypothetical protein
MPVGNSGITGLSFRKVAYRSSMVRGVGGLWQVYPLMYACICQAVSSLAASQQDFVSISHLSLA